MSVSVLDLGLLTLRVSRKRDESAALSALEVRAVVDHIDWQQFEIARLRETIHSRMDAVDRTRDKPATEIEALKHDLDEYRRIVKDLTDENERLRAAVEALASIVRRDRIALHQAHHHHPHSGEVDDDGKRGLAEYDAALRLADAALDNDTERA